MDSSKGYLENKVALVTGSTSGIGLGVAKGLAARGCKIVLNGFGDEQLIQGLQDDFQKEFQVDAAHVPGDLSKVADIENLCQQIKKIHPWGVDILVNNAGFQHVSPIETFPDDKWDAMLAVMLSAPFHLIKRIVPDMKQKGWGRIVNIASAHGVVASPNKAAYVACKHGIVGLTKVVALETAETGVTCNALCPGYVETPILQGQVQTLADKENLSYDEAKAKFLANFHATKEAVSIQSLADTVAFMCSESASQMTGSSIVLDGGWTAK